MLKTLPLPSVFITGGSSGIGEGLALSYLRRGAVVAVAARRRPHFEQSKLYQRALQEQWWQKTLFFYELDVSSKEQTLEAFRAFEQQLSTLHLPPLGLVIANAGIGNPNKQRRPNFELSEQILKVNLLGALYTAQAAYQSMVPRRCGHLVFISSVAAKIGMATNGPYCASKAGLVTMAEAFAQDWSSDGIQVSVHLPGFVDTPLTQKNNHQMPFLMSCDVAVARIMRAIDRQQFYDIFPWPTALFVTVLAWIPKNWYIKLSKYLTFYRRKGDHL